MRFSKPVNLGIVACPGAEVFADDIILNLKKNYSKKHKQKADLFSRMYGMERAEVDKQINFIIDVEDANLNISGDVEKYRAPEFKVPVKYTMFANGEFKSEILATVRGMNIFIVQDVENHYPIDINGDGKKRALSVNDHVFTLFATIDAVIQSGARSVSIVVPAYPYARLYSEELLSRWG